MNDQEFAAAEAKLAERDNEIAALAATEAQCVEQVRLFASGRRDAATKRASIELATKPLREALAQAVAERRKQHAEQMRAAAEAKAKEEAAKPREPTQLEVLAAKVDELTRALAAKG